MDNIEKVRAKISMYDDEIIKILSKRMDCIDEIMQYKKEKRAGRKKKGTQKQRSQA